MLHSNRLGQGLPISTIVIALLGLIVLVILVVLVQTQVAKTGKGLRNVSEAQCAAPNYVDTVGAADCDVIYGSFSNVQTGLQVCCRGPKT